MEFTDIPGVIDFRFVAPDQVLCLDSNTEAYKILDFLGGETREEYLLALAEEGIAIRYDLEKDQYEISRKNSVDGGEGC